LVGSTPRGAEKNKKIKIKIKQKKNKPEKIKQKKKWSCLVSYDSSFISLKPRFTRSYGSQQ
jgi:hypothetical protein